ncbi:DNA-directed RNA polymerase III subunit rpc-3 [Podosphaera aphanis]|nr:DNA-directed RNA polymerase III subunit rpc-3 [Podosphaera aphanis]
MSTTKNAAELCALLVNEIYGELTFRIFTVLLRRGRLSIPLLTKHTLLTPRQIRHGLVVLVQQNLVYHNVDEDSGSTQYEANSAAAYALVRSGKIMEAVESRYGAVAREVVQNLFLLGHTKISHLEGAYQSRQNQQNSNLAENEKVNEPHNAEKHQIHTMGQLHSVLLRLLQAGVIEEVFEHMFRSPTDTYNQIEKEVVGLYFGGSAKGAKQVEELKMKVQARLQSMRSNTQKWQMKGKKRSHNNNDLNNSSKRRRLSDNGTFNVDHYYEDNGAQLDPQMIVRINYEKCIVFLRTQQLVLKVNDRIGETTSLIYEAALRMIEEKIPRCRLNPQIDNVKEEVKGPVFTTMELTASIGDTIDPSQGIAQTTANSRGDQHKTNSHQEQENKTQQIKNHLLLLAGDQFKFLRKCGNAGLGEWTANFQEIVQHLREAELDSMLLENFGAHGHRLARIIRKLGKLEDKFLPNVALLKHKELQRILAGMHISGVVDIQEVPKDATRSSLHRTMFLWYFDTKRVSDTFVNKLYKIMLRAFQRLDTERKKAMDVIQLTQRSDVQGQLPEDYLDKDQLTQLTRYQIKEQALLTQISRVDELVGIFCDY